MKRDVVLSIQGRQRYGEQEPETIELVTGGTMEFRDGGWDITYEESELTGLAGVVTTFRVEPGKVTLNREGALICPLLHQLDQKGRLDWLVFTNDDRQHAKILLYHVSIFLQLYHKREKSKRELVVLNISAGRDHSLLFQFRNCIPKTEGSFTYSSGIAGT